MKRRHDIVYAIALVLLLILSYLIGNAIIKGIVLLLFSAALIFNTAMKMKMKKDDSFAKKFFLGILMFFELLLALGAIFVIISAIIAA